MKVIEKNIDTIKKLCAKHKVNRLYVFGSVLDDSFNRESDIDLLVSFQNIPLENYADNYFDLKFELEKIFDRPVDLLEEQAIKNPIFRRIIDQTKMLVYEG